MNQNVDCMVLVDVLSPSGKRNLDLVFSSVVRSDVFIIMFFTQVTLAVMGGLKQ